MPTPEVLFRDDCGCTAIRNVPGTDATHKFVRCPLHARAEQTTAERDRYKREREDLLLELKVAHPDRHGVNCRVCVKIAACEEEKDVSEG